MFTIYNNVYIHTCSYYLPVAVWHHATQECPCSVVWLSVVLGVVCLTHCLWEVVLNGDVVTLVGRHSWQPVLRVYVNGDTVTPHHLLQEHTRTHTHTVTTHTYYTRTPHHTEVIASNVCHHCGDNLVVSNYNSLM